ncbi:MAG: peptidase, partial [Rhodobacteraceae bacterium]|nr:peptidase [Paracoccaceae bacterium]
MNWRDDALAHALAEMPREACGLVVVVRGKERYWPCRNISPTYADDQFAMDPHDYAAAEAAGEIVELFHSHINIPP